MISRSTTLSLIVVVACFAGACSPTDPSTDEESLDESFVFRGQVRLDGSPVSYLMVVIVSDDKCSVFGGEIRCVLLVRESENGNFELQPNRPASWISSGFCGSGTISFTLGGPGAWTRSSEEIRWTGCGPHTINYNFPSVAP